MVIGGKVGFQEGKRVVKSSDRRRNEVNIFQKPQLKRLGQLVVIRFEILRAVIAAVFLFEAGVVIPTAGGMHGTSLTGLFHMAGFRLHEKGHTLQLILAVVLVDYHTRRADEEEQGKGDME